MKTKPESKAAAKVWVIEDEPAVRRTISNAVNNMEGFTVTGVYPSAELALAELVSNPPAIVLLDILLPGMDGWACARGLRAEKTPPKIIFLSAVHESSAVATAIRLHCSYLTKPFDRRELVEALHAALHGSVHLSDGAAHLVERREKPNQVAKPYPAELWNKLTTWEQTLLVLSASGLTDKEVADIVGRSVHTVKNLLTAIRLKLDVESTKEAIHVTCCQGSAEKPAPAKSSSSASSTAAAGPGPPKAG